jgi:hypothetical protein
LSKPISISHDLQKCLRAFDAEAELSTKRFHRAKKAPIDWYNDPNQAYVADYESAFSTRIETVDAIAIHIPHDRIDNFLEMFDDKKYQEMIIRDQVPAVKKAYEHYKLLLKMCGGDIDARY